MGAYGLLLIAALVLVSGVIAYVGDIIGRRMGRKRLTLFHLRPRHTAIVISVIAGMLIAAFTLVSAMLVSENVRDAFMHVETMRRDNARLAHEARVLEAQAQSSRRRAAAALRELAAITAQLDARTALLERQKRDLEGSKRELAATKGQLSATAAELERKIAELAAQREKLRVATAGAQTAERRLADVTAQLDRRTRELSATQRNLNDTKTSLDDANAQLKNATRILLQNHAELVASQEKLNSLQEKLSGLESLFDSAVQRFDLIRTQPVIFGTGAEILAALVKGGRPEREVLADLRNIVSEINDAAIEAGAGKGRDGRAIDVTRPVQEEGTRDIVYYDEAQVLDALAATIGAAKGSVIVRATSMRNVVKGETVLVDFQLIRNDLVLRKGQELARMSADSKLDEPALLLQLVGFLRTKVSARAKEAGVMARPARRDISSRDLFPEPDEAVGQIRYPELLQVIRDIRARKGMVQVTARAAADTWTAGPLQVKLQVEDRAASAANGRR